MFGYPEDMSEWSKNVKNVCEKLKFREYHSRGPNKINIYYQNSYKTYGIVLLLEIVNFTSVL